MPETKKLIFGFFVYRLFRYSYFHVAIGLVYFQSIGLTLAQALSLESIYYITKAISDVPGGYFADKIGRKTSLIVSSLFCAQAYAVIGFGRTYAVFAMAEVMLGVAMSLATTSDSALLYDELKARGEGDRYEQAEGTGWAMRNLGFGAASAVGAWIAAATSLATPFLISASVISFSVLFILFFLHEPHFKENKSTKPWFRSLGTILRQPGFFLIILFFAVTFLAVRIGFWAFQPMLEYLGIELRFFGVLFGAMLAISLAAALRISWVKRMPGGPWTVLTILTSACFLVIGIGAEFAGTAGLLIALSGFAIHSVAQGLYDPVMRREINMLSDGPVRASTMAVATMLGNVTFAAIAPVYGWSIAAYGHPITMVWIGLSVGFFAGVLAFQIQRRIRIGVMDAAASP